MSDYTEVAKHLNTVRRAWKRTAALSGLAVAVLEFTGIFTVALLVDVLYRPLPPVRVGVFVAALAALGYLLTRHVVGPVLRRIPDAQAALYVEEHDPRFEGALIAAAEFHRAELLAGRDAALVEAAITSAAARAERFDLRRVADFSRLRKYGVAAALVVVGYFAAGVSFPTTVGRHAGRVLRPWRPTAEDLPSVEPLPPAKPPITFALSKGNTSLLRGSAFALDAVLSRASDHPVFLFFHPVAEEEAEARWRHLRMDEGETLRGYRITLQDVTEDLEFYVGTGPAKSETCRVTVYDPLVLEGVELVTRFPTYLKLKDRTDVRVTGDVAAPIGSTVTVRLLTNGKLAEGELSWEDGSKLPLSVDPELPTSALASFEVKADTTYTFRVRDVNGQTAESPGSARVRALVDKPPTVQITLPMETVDLHPLGEVTVLAEATDDFALEGAELVYMRLSDVGQNPLRAPLDFETTEEWTPGQPVLGRARTNFRLEDVRPSPEPEESIGYYVECRDRKGQKAVSDIFFITVVHYETWATWLSEPAEMPEESEIRSLEPYFRAAWHLHGQKPMLPVNDYNKQSEELADSMTDPQTGQLYTFAETKDPTKQKHVDRAAEFVGKGHQALLEHDTGRAVEAFAVALAEIAKLDLFEEYAHIIPEGQIPAVEGAEPLEQLALLEAQRVEAEAAQAQMQGSPEASDLEQARQAEEIAHQAEVLEQQQAAVAEDAREMANGEAEGQPQPQQAEGEEAEGEEGEAPQQPAQGEEGGNEQNQQGDANSELAQRQDGVADRAREITEEAADDAAADPSIRQMTSRIDRAAAQMRRAAQRMRTGRMEQAALEAERAQRTLREIREQAGNIAQAKLERALDDAEARAERLLDNQQQARAKAEALGKGKEEAKQPDARRQRDFQVAAAEQVRLKTDLSRVERDVRALRQMAESGARPETAKHIENAHRDLQRGRADQKMDNAVVELAARNPKGAAQEQRRVEGTLGKTLENIRAANDSLASDIQSELRRARNEARRVQEDLERMDGSQTPQPGQPAPPRPRDLAEQGQQTAYEIRRLAKHLEQRQFAEKADRDFLNQAARQPGQLGQRVARDEKERKQVLRVVRRVRNRLEVEYQSKLQAKKLFAAQREACPPQYRHLVNKYYEALSQARN